MNYFELYDISESISVDLGEVKTVFFKLSKKHHPDFFVNKSQEEQDEALEISTLNTKAYSTFKDQNALIKYILDINGYLENIEKEKLSPDFLMEMMDINESLMELEFDWDQGLFDKVSVEFSNVNDILSQELKMIEEVYALKEGLSYDNYKNLKNYYLKNKYLLRIKETIDKFALRS